MVSKIKDFNAFMRHVRTDQTISDISLALDRWRESCDSSFYEYEFVEPHIGEAIRLLNEFSRQVLAMAEAEIVQKEETNGKSSNA